ncbi:MAG TPA: hypothetical protein VM939_00290 [Gemmatimonadaceae bacterium]|nr:hypothetical protein [Gemmatimonadaceae bacterium]
MINLIEALFGAAAALMVAAVVARARRKRRGARTLGGVGVGFLLCAILLEIYVRLFP